MGEEPKKATGRNYYKAKGLRGILFRVPRNTRISLGVLSERLNKPIYMTVGLILRHFLSCPEKYKINGKPSWDHSVDITTFVESDVRKEMRLKGIYAELSLKDLAGHVVHQYITKHCQANLGDSDGDQ